MLERGWPLLASTADRSRAGFVLPFFKPALQIFPPINAQTIDRVEKKGAHGKPSFIHRKRTASHDNSILNTNLLNFVRHIVRLTSMPASHRRGRPTHPSVTTKEKMNLMTLPYPNTFQTCTSQSPPDLTSPHLPPAPSTAPAPYNASPIPHNAKIACGASPRAALSSRLSFLIDTLRAACSEESATSRRKTVGGLGRGTRASKTASSSVIVIVHAQLSEQYGRE